ncbi:MAG: sigma-54-dependent Fis family transcriptional regulator, partial [Deltaproteobacteria bacterium]
PIHCGAIPESLLESELFGHVAGAFTGAERNKKGRLELAHGGTVFLDEVGETSPNVQVKLLRVLEDKVVEPLGAEGGRKTDIRIVAATNRNLKQLVKEGKFREDLYYRLAVVTIELPPLRERRSDIPLLAEYLLERECAELGCSSAGISPDAMAALMDHDWPGNVRELQNALRHALVLSGRGRLEARHLPEAIVSTGLGRRGRPRKLTREHVMQALEKAKNNRKRAAEILGVSRSTLYRYLEQ